MEPLILDSLDRLDARMRSRGYAGYCKFDALNSRLIERAFGGCKLGRLLATQAVNRVPLPLRRWAGVCETINPKGIANCIRAYSALGKSGDVRQWADWLLRNDSRSLGAFSGRGMAWGYPFPWQSPGFYAHRNAPNCIVTVFCGEALLAAAQSLSEGKYLNAAVQTAEYLLSELPTLESTREELCIGYVAGPLSWKVVNINAVTAGFLAKLAVVANRNDFLELAKRLVAWVWLRRDPRHGFWNYTDPIGQSGIGPDSYHTGGILEGIWDYYEVSDDIDGQERTVRVMDEYRARFFDWLPPIVGAPRWRLNRRYPIDIHGSAQGILTLLKGASRNPGFKADALKIADWAITHMQDPKNGYFYYQKWRFFTWKEELMRWNNSWMLRALAELVRSK